MTITTALAQAVAHSEALDRIHEHIDDLEQSITSLINASWGTADDGSTSIRCPHGTGAEIIKRLLLIAQNTPGICEHPKTAGQPGSY